MKISTAVSFFDLEDIKVITYRKKRMGIQLRRQNMVVLVSRATRLISCLWRQRGADRSEGCIEKSSRPVSRKMLVEAKA